MLRVLFDRRGDSYLTREASTYFAGVKEGGEFIQPSLSRGFGTEAEARCYFLGAGVSVQWR